MKLVIVIDGESADDLFTCGVEDIMSHFLPTGLSVKTDDIKECRFEEIKPEEKEKKLRGEKYTYTAAKDNFHRDDS